MLIHNVKRALWSSFFYVLKKHLATYNKLTTFAVINNMTNLTHHILCLNKN